MKRETIFSLLTAGLVVCVFLFLAGGMEWYYRQQHQQFIRTFRKPDMTLRKASTPGLIYEHIPHASPEFNSFGFRDVEHSPAKPPGRFRIIIVGDSVAAGHYLPFDAMFCRQLQHILDARTPGRYEVILTAVTGYSTAQELILLQKAAFPLQPDLVVWSYCLNDPAHPLYHDANGELGPYFYTPDSFLWFNLKRKWFLLRESLRSIGLPNEFHWLLHTLYWEEVEKNLGQVAQQCRERNIPVVLAILPVFEIKRLANTPDYVLQPDAYALKKINKDLCALAERRGMHPLDLLDSFSRHPMRELMLRPKDPWHPNALGNRRIAESLYAYLLRQRLLPR